jgi:hypothetical protein
MSEEKPTLDPSRSRSGSQAASSAPSPPAPGRTPDAEHARKNLEHFFTSVKDVVEGEMLIQDADWQFIASASGVLVKKYDGIAEKALQVTSVIDQVEAQYEALAPYFSQIDELESNIDMLESLTKAVEAYGKGLEEKYCL